MEKLECNKQSNKIVVQIAHQNYTLYQRNLNSQNQNFSKYITRDKIVTLNPNH